ncbi:MAG: transcriptional regulator [Sphingobium sp.]|nr:transcriptional regulator [Sphingobium sp.]
MQMNGAGRHDPVREIFAMLGDKWSTLILLVLELGTWRHTDLRRILIRLSETERISQRMMTLKLRGLEREGLVERKTTADIPPKVSYCLTDMGQNLMGEVHGLLNWVERHRVPIQQARMLFDDGEEL